MGSLNQRVPKEFISPNAPECIVVFMQLGFWFRCFTDPHCGWVVLYSSSYFDLRGTLILAAYEFTLTREFLNVMSWHWVTGWVLQHNSGHANGGTGSGKNATGARGASGCSHWPSVVASRHVWQAHRLGARIASTWPRQHGRVVEPGAGFRRVSRNCGEPHRKMRDKTMVFSLWLHQRRVFGRRILSHQALPNTKSTHAKPDATPSRPTWTIPTALVPCESAHGTKSRQNGAGFALVMNVAQQECR